MRSPTSMDNNIVPIFQLMCFVKTISESFNVDSLDILCGFQSFPSSFSFPLNKFPHLIKISEKDSPNSNKTHSFTTYNS